MIPHLSFEVHESSQVGEARRAAVRLASELGFDDVSIGRVALVVTELGTNLVRHAQGGRILMGAGHLPPVPMLEVLALDSGPGMADVRSFQRDGFSTSGTPGTGLGAVERLADEFSIFSSPGRGTVAMARVRLRSSARSGVNERPPFTVGAICLAAPGETVSGDGWRFQSEGHTASVMVADGLGHGPLAAVASDAALELFAAMPGQAPCLVLERAHVALRGTRGSAVAVAALDAEAGRIAFCGAGNVAGRLLSGIEDRSLLSQHGTVGLQIRRLQAAEYAWPDHGILVLHSDGLVTRWALADTPGLFRCHPAVIAGWLIRDHCRGRDDATIVVVRRETAP